MNLTRRILEGIHEVELEITPEFQQPEKPKKPHEPSDLDQKIMVETLEKYGWKELHYSTSPDGTINTHTYGIPGTEGKIHWSVRNKTGNVLAKMLVRVSPGHEAEWVDATSHMVRLTTQRALAVAGMKTLPGKKDPRKLEIVNVVHMLVDLDWFTLSEEPIFSTGAKVRVFAHPKVGKRIRVSYDPDGSLIGAMILSADGTLVESFDASPASVYREAQKLMKEAGV